MPLVAVEHELAEQDAVVDERDECERRDPLVDDAAFELGGEAGLPHVGDEHGLRVDGVRGPRCVPLRRRAVGIREAAPRCEPHHSLLVGEEDGRAVGGSRRDQQVDGLGEELVEASGAGDELRDPVERIELGHARAKLFALADVPRRSEQMRDGAVPVEDRGAGRFEGDPAAVACPEPCRDLAWHFPRAHRPDPGLRDRVVGRVHHLDEGRADESVGLPAEHRLPRRGRVDDRPDRIGDRDQVVRALEHELLKGREVDEVVSLRWYVECPHLSHQAPSPANRRHIVHELLLVEKPASPRDEPASRSF